jgi:hypothetical protein
MANVVSGLSGRYSRNTGFATVFLIISLPLCLNAWYIRDQYKCVDPLSYLSGGLSREEYIAKFRPEYPAIRYINDNLPYDARILFIYLGNRGYYCDREYIFDTYRNRSAFRQLVKASSDPEAIYLGLKGMEITHLLIRYDIFDKWVKTDFTARDREVMKAFFKEYVKFVFFKWGYGVSVIREPI